MHDPPDPMSMCTYDDSDAPRISLLYEGMPRMRLHRCISHDRSFRLVVNRIAVAAIGATVSRRASNGSALIAVREQVRRMCFVGFVGKTGLILSTSRGEEHASARSWNRSLGDGHSTVHRCPYTRGYGTARLTRGCSPPTEPKGMEAIEFAGYRGWFSFGRLRRVLDDDSTR